MERAEAQGRALRSANEVCVVVQLLLSREGNLRQAHMNSCVAFPFSARFARRPDLASRESEDCVPKLSSAQITRANTRGSRNREHPRPYISVAFALYGKDVGISPLLTH